MRALLLAAVVLAAGAALPGSANGTCVPTIVWRGDDYVGHHLRTTPGSKLSPQAILPACNDTGEDEPDTKTDVRRISGVDPRAAITTGADRLYVNSHTFPQLKSHPLHKRLRYTNTPKPRTGKPCTVVGTAHPGPISMFVRNRDGVTYIDVAVDTEISLKRDGVVYIATGEEIRVTGRPCRLGPGDRSVGAVRITRSSP